MTINQHIVNGGIKTAVTGMWIKEHVEPISEMPWSKTKLEWGYRFTCRW